MLSLPYYISVLLINTKVIQMTIFLKLSEGYLYCRESTAVTFDWFSLVHCLNALTISTALKQCTHLLGQTLID